MSQRDLVAELRAARIEAPPEVQARVRLIAAADTTSTRRRTFTWRRALVLAVPVAAAVAATIVFTRPSHQPTAVQPVERGIVHAAEPSLKLNSAGSTFAPAPTTTRVQRYGAYLALRVPTPNGVSTGRPPA